MPSHTAISLQTYLMHEKNSKIIDVIHKQNVYGHNKIIERRHIVLEKLSFLFSFYKECLHHVFS